MPDVYATITDADPEVVERIAEILELRGRVLRPHRYAEPDRAQTARALRQLTV